MQKPRGLLLILVTLLLSASIIVAYNSGAYKRNRAAVADYPNWMRRLVDTKLDKEESPPGIHDTMTISKKRAVNRDVCGGVLLLQDQRHSMTLQRQLDLEIRHVDIRSAYTEEAETDVSPFVDALVQVTDENSALNTPTTLSFAFAHSKGRMNAAAELNVNRDEPRKATYVSSDNQEAPMNVPVNDHFEDGEETAAFTVLNVAPTVTARGDIIDGMAAIKGRVFDPGILDTSVVTIEWGHGTDERKSLLASSLGTQTVTYEEKYVDDGPGPGTSPTYDNTVDVTVTDKAGCVGSNSDTVTVNNVDPTASIDSVIDELGNQIGDGLKCASFVLVGLPLTGTFSFADTGMPNMHSAAVDWKDGSTVSFYDFPAITPFSEVHTYATCGVFDVSLTVTNDDSGTVVVSETIEVLESTEAVLRTLEALRDLVLITDEEQELFQNTTAALEGNVKDGLTSISGALHMLSKNDWNGAFMKIGEALTFMGMLDDLLEDDDLTACKSVLVLAVKSILMDLFENSGGKPTFQKRVEDKIGEGDEAAHAGSYEGAVTSYSEALHSLEQAPKATPPPSREL